ncbi:glycine betaine ABC transporter substrate-binding protein [Streptomyces sp. NBC_01615]
MRSAKRTKGMCLLPASRRTCLLLAGALVLASGCGLTSGSPMVDNVEPGSIGQGKPLKGAHLTVTSKEFTEQLILGAIMGIAFQAAGADVLDRTGIQGSIGSREAVKNGDADAMYEYTGTAWITYLGNSKPIPDPQQQWQAVRDADLKNGLTWLPPSALNNTYALAMNQANFKKYGTKTLSDVAALSKTDPGAVTLCVESEFANRADGLPGMEKAYGMDVPAKNITQMDTGIIYTQVAKGSCTYGEVFTTDGRIKSMHLEVMQDDKKFFPNYNAAPVINSKALKEYPAIAEVIDPVTKKLNNTVAQELNAKVDVQGQDPHEVALDWMTQEGFVKGG